MTVPLWTTDAFLSAMNARLDGLKPQAITGISIDTRTLEPGDAFFAIQGESRDGHDFVEAALAGGAAIAVVATSKAQALSGKGALACVGDDILAAMGDLARARRRALSAQVVAVTGSVGKTGTKEALRACLMPQGKTHAPVKSYNNHWGVPLTLARTPVDIAFGVYEIGMSNPGEIAPLARMVEPDVALITTVQPVHLARFESVDGIADEKADIFKGLKPGGTAIINADIAQVERLAGHARAAGAGQLIRFGEAADADVRLLRCVLHADLSIVEADVMGTPVTYKIGSPGRHIVLNSLGVLAAVTALGADLAQAALALGTLTPPEGRGARQSLSAPGGLLTLIDESYNANPASVKAALDNLGRTQPGSHGRRIAVLGDMLELGPTGPELHAGLVETIAANGIDLVFACGPLMRHLYDSLPAGRRGAYAPAATGLEPLVLDALHAGDVVTVKGSLGSKMGPIVKAILARFPEQPREG